MVRRNFYFVSWTEAAMDDQQAGPSGINLRPKRPRIEVRDPNRLTYNEMEQILYNSDSEISDLDSDFEVISAIIENLLPEGEDKPPQPRKTMEHMPKKIEATNPKGKTLRKKCRICSQKKIRKDTVYYCSDCPEQPGLCLERCFKIYHSKKD